MPVTKTSWASTKLEELNPLISRRVITTKDTMFAQIYLKKGAVVPGHHHINEQLTYVVEGCLRFWIDDHAMNPGTNSSTCTPVNCC